VPHAPRPNHAQLAPERTGRRLKYACVEKIIAVPENGLHPTTAAYLKGPFQSLTRIMNKRKISSRSFSGIMFRLKQDVDTIRRPDDPIPGYDALSLVILGKLDHEFTSSETRSLSRLQSRTRKGGPGVQLPLLSHCFK